MKKSDSWVESFGMCLGARIDYQMVNEMMGNFYMERSIQFIDDRKMFPCQRVMISYRYDISDGHLVEAECTDGEGMLKEFEKHNPAIMNSNDKHETASDYDHIGIIEDEWKKEPGTLPLVDFMRLR